MEPQVESLPHIGPKPGTSQRRRGRGQAATGQTRSLYLDAGTNALLVALADRLQWSESRTADRLIQLGLLPYRCQAAGGLDVLAIAERLVQFEMARVGAQEG